MAAYTITGMKEIDRKLAAMPEKMRNNAIAKAARNAAKKTLANIRALTPKDTGAMAASFQVRAVTKKVKEETGTLKEGVSKNGRKYTFRVKRVVATERGGKVQINRKSLVKQATKRGKKYTEDDKYFYPVYVELGGGGDSGQKPMRTGLRESEDQVRAEFVSNISKFVNSQ